MNHNSQSISSNTQNSEKVGFLKIKKMSEVKICQKTYYFMQSQFNAI